MEELPAQWRLIVADYLVTWTQSGTPGETIIYNVQSMAEAAWFAALDSEEITDPTNAKLVDVVRLTDQ